MKPKPKSPYRLGGDPKDREIVKLRDKASYLEKELKKLHRQALDEDEVRRIIGIIANKTEKPPTWLIKHKAGKNSPEVPVVQWSDWHGGETVSLAETNGVNEFDIAIMKRRVRRLVERTIRLADRHGGTYPGAVLNLLGDFVSGGLHPELEKTDEREVLVSLLIVRDLLVWAIECMVDRFGQLYIPCTSGNHGRNTHKPEFKRYVYKNYDWLLYQLLARHFARDKRIVFDIRPSNEVYYSVFNKRFLAMHGDMLGVKGGDGIIGAIGPIMRGEVKVRGSAVEDFDFLLIGHWHQPLWLPRCICNNALKGYDEYAKNKLRAPPSVPSQLLFFVHPHHGVTSRWEIYLEGVLEGVTAEWLTVFDPVALVA